MIIKFVNTSEDPQEVSLDIKGPKLHTIGEAHILSSMDLTNENSFESPMAISPVMEQVKNTGGKVNISLKENSLMVVMFTSFAKPLFRLDL